MSSRSRLQKAEKGGQKPETGRPATSSIYQPPSASRVSSRSLEPSRSWSRNGPGREYGQQITTEMLSQVSDWH